MMTNEIKKLLALFFFSFAGFIVMCMMRVILLRPKPVIDTITGKGDYTISTFQGGDKKEGLDLDGRFLYAIDVNSQSGTKATAGVKIRDAVFADESKQNTKNSSGLAVKANYSKAAAYGIRPEYGKTTNDDNLEAIVHCLGWGHNMYHQLPVVKGRRYKMQAVYSENRYTSAGHRRFNLQLYDGTVNSNGKVYVSTDEMAAPLHHWAGKPNEGVVVTAVFTALSDVITLQHFEGTKGRDVQPLLNALTLEEID